MNFVFSSCRVLSPPKIHTFTPETPSITSEIKTAPLNDLEVELIHKLHSTVTHDSLKHGLTCISMTLIYLNMHRIRSLKD